MVRSGTWCVQVHTQGQIRICINLQFVNLKRLFSFSCRVQNQTLASRRRCGFHVQDIWKSAKSVDGKCHSGKKKVSTSESAEVTEHRAFLAELLCMRTSSMRRWRLTHSRLPDILLIPVVILLSSANCES